VSWRGRPCRWMESLDWKFVAQNPPQRDQAHPVNDQAVRRVLEAASVEFIEENGGGPGVRPRKRQKRSQEKRPDRGLVKS
jgi:hypothetical protein